MIWSLMFVPITLLINFIVSLLPNTPSVSTDLSVLISFIQKGMYFTNSSIFATCISVFVTFEGLSLGWNIVKFIYGKIPFLNIR